MHEARGMCDGTNPVLQFDTHEANAVGRRILRELDRADGCRVSFR